MKNLIAVTLIASITLSAHAQQSCPLTNSRLVDLRSAASKLAKTITLSAECKAYQDTVNQANAQLKDIANQIAAVDDNETNPEDGPDLKDTAAKAVAQLDTISTLFKDQRCGAQLVGFLDYASVFVDVATSMVPFLSMYGGAAAMPWVLGPAIGGASAKALITFFKNKSIDMRNPDQSNAFLKNSCSFYNLNQIKESLDDLEMRQSPAIENELKESRNRLAQHIASQPAEPKSDIVDVLKRAEKDQETIKFLQEQMKNDAIDGCNYIQAYASKQDPVRGSGTLVERIWQNYEKTLEASSFRLEMERKLFLDDLNTSVASAAEAVKCNRWLNKMNLMSDAGLAFIRKSALEDSSSKIFHNWKEEKLKIEETIKLQEARMKFFNELTGEGFNIEYSEIIRSHEQVQDSLFDSYRWLLTLKMKGLAEAWLKVKREDADLDMRDFIERRKEVFGRLTEIQKKIGLPVTKTNVTRFSSEYKEKNNREHPEIYQSVVTDMCNQLRRTWTSWYNGSIHAKAGKDYCVAFDRVINKMDYPEVQTLCFGTTTKNGKKKIHSLKNQVNDFKAKKPLADEVIVKMRDLSCKEGLDMSSELLAQPIN